MAYAITSFDDSAEGFPGGVRYFTAQVDVQSGLSAIDWFPKGSKAISNAGVVYYKCPSTGHWVLPAATPILITKQPTDLTVTEGAVTETVSLTCYAQDASAEYTPTYQWSSCTDINKANPSTIAGQTTSTLTIPTDVANSSSPYFYFCTITANSNKTLDSAVIKVTVNKAAE